MSPRYNFRTNRASSARYLEATTPRPGTNRITKGNRAETAAVKSENHSQNSYAEENVQNSDSAPAPKEIRLYFPSKEKEHHNGQGNLHHQINRDASEENIHVPRKQSTPEKRIKSEHGTATDSNIYDYARFNSYSQSVSYQGQQTVGAERFCCPPSNVTTILRFKLPSARHQFASVQVIRELKSSTFRRNSAYKREAQLLRQRLAAMIDRRRYSAKEIIALDGLLLLKCGKSPLQGLKSVM